MAEAFDVTRVSPNPARFDLKKCTAINADWIRALEPADLKRRLEPFLVIAGLIADPPTAEQDHILTQAIPLVQERIETLKQAADMLGFLLVDDENFAIEEGQSVSDEVSQQVIAAALEALTGLESWESADIEASLRAALIDGLGLKPKAAFGAVRIAVSGRRISPPLFESMQILGRERSMARLAAAQVR